MLHTPEPKLILPVCPTCSNMLRVSKVNAGDPTTEDSVGQNRFECLTCPYHYVIDKRYYERKTIKRKEVEDILGGKGAWDNVDKTEGMLARKRFKKDTFFRYRRLTTEQCNVQTKSAGTTRRTGTSCRFVVLMSL